MTLKNLLSALTEYSQIRVPEPFASEEVAGITDDSRKVKSGYLFIAIKGHQRDGHDSIPDAIRNGARYLIIEDQKKQPQDFQGFVLHLNKTRRIIDQLASRFYSDPSRRLLMFGITGTNGKTSCTYMIEHICQFCGIPTGVIGTINHHLKDKVWDTQVTTPGPLELQERLKQMQDAGARAVAMEVSSHALFQHRVDSVHFNSVLFTNLTQDHLDYHQTMQEYFLAKQKLFTDLLWKSTKVPVFAIINTDDSYGRKLRIAGFAGLWTYGQKKNCDFSFSKVRTHFSKTEFELKTPFGTVSASIPLCGLHNVYNAVGVMAMAASVGIPISYSLRALSTFTGVPGRLQAVTNPKNVHIFVDYAHSPDALENVLSTLRQVRQESAHQGKIVTVFGCGGDRDKAKRSMMGEIAERLSDQIIVTSDNPRTEEPSAIISDILSGLKEKKHLVQVDRRKAIQLAIEQCQAGDILLIAGKGHEDYQIIGNTKTHFSDVEVVTEFFQTGLSS